MGDRLNSDTVYRYALDLRNDGSIFNFFRFIDPNQQTAMHI